MSSCLAAVRDRVRGGAGASRVDGIRGEWMVSGALADGRAEGYAWRELMQTFADVAGKPRLMLHVPAQALFLLAAGSMIGEGWRPGTAALTFGKVRELTHRDWGIRPHETAPNAPQARFDLEAGFAHTLHWYRKNGWL